MRSAEEMQKLISWVYLNHNYIAAKAIIIKELVNWEKDVRKDQAENDAEVVRLVLKAT